MRTRATFFFLSFTLTGFILLSGNSFAQQKSDDQTKGKKTITIHVTKEVDGNTVVIDTTVVTDGEFDADAFLEGKGVMNDIPEAGKNVEKHIIIRHPDTQEFNWSDSDAHSPDTIIINDDRVLIYSDKFDMPAPPPPHMGMPYDYNFNMQQEFPHFNGPQFEDMFEGMARTFGLENVMPFGEMKQMVVKKKRNGKKVIITFEDRKAEKGEQSQGNKKEEKVIIYKNGDQSSAPQNKEQVILEGQPGENVVIHKKIVKTENGDQVIINAEVEQPKSVKMEKKVIIITEEGTK
jgi:hypothetical protein